MQITLAAVGRARLGPLRDLYEEYVGRLQWSLTLREVDVRKNLSPEVLRQAESEQLLACVPKGSVIIALDERGQSLPSKTFAEKMQRWQDQGVSHITFLIGGADGHADLIRQKANFLWALGPMTWPHMLVRVLVAEQIYRAQQIIAGHPYHRN